MKIATALGLDNEVTGGMISFVGGGGKTSSIFALANELAGAGRKVLITTTTAMYNPEGIENPNIDILGDHVTGEGKLKGISKERADQLFDGKKYDVILVEADGSKGLPIKAPAGYEPVVPSATTVMVGVIGIDCFGKAVDPAFVHRPELFAALTGVPCSGIVEDNAILRLVSSPEGLFKNCPEGAKKVFLINKVMDGASEEIAKRIGGKALETCDNIHGVLIGAVQEKEPIKVRLSPLGTVEI